MKTICKTDRYLVIFIFCVFIFTPILKAENLDISIQEDENLEKTTKPVESFIRTGMITPYLKLGGYAMLTYQYREAENIHDVRPRLAFISMDGKIGSNFRYFLLAEFVNPRLFEYYGEWTFSKYIGIKVGQQKVPFALENPISPTNMESILNTRTVSSLVGMNDDVGVTTSGRDIGMQIFGSFFDGLLSYNAGFFQGTGINIKENNQRKDFSGILSLQPIKNFHIAGSLYLGEAVYSINDNPLTSNTRNRWALSADYETERFYARSEWINGNDAGTLKSGIYGTALWYFVPKKINGFLKLDFFDADTSIGSVATDYIVGGSYYFAPRCRLQLNYMHSQYSANWQGNLNRNSLFAQMQVVF